jgi:hypothetical protein
MVNVLSWEQFLLDIPWCVLEAKGNPKFPDSGVIGRSQDFNDASARTHPKNGANPLFSSSFLQPASTILKQRTRRSISQ